MAGKCKTLSGDSSGYMWAQDLSESVTLFDVYTCRRQIKLHCKGMHTVGTIKQHHLPKRRRIVDTNHTPENFGFLTDSPSSQHSPRQMRSGLKLALPDEAEKLTRPSQQCVWLNEWCGSASRFEQTWRAGREVFVKVRILRWDRANRYASRSTHSQTFPQTDCNGI